MIFVVFEMLNWHAPQNRHCSSKCQGLALCALNKVLNQLRDQKSIFHINIPRENFIICLEKLKKKKSLNTSIEYLRKLSVNLMVGEICLGRCTLSSPWPRAWGMGHKICWHSVTPAAEEGTPFWTAEIAQGQLVWHLPKLSRRLSPAIGNAICI